MASPIESLIQKYNPQTSLDYENALKELLQEITLAGLASAGFFDKAAFYGGTALRVFYGLPRFSEDLDFTLFQVQPDFKLKPYFSRVESSLASFGFDVQIDEVEKSENRTVESAFLKANTKMHLMKIRSAVPLAGKIQANKNLAVKFEVDVYPPLGFETETQILLPPISASVKVLKPSSLFAGKMHAVLFRRWKNRVKGRDFYDLLWYLGQGIPLKLAYLEQKMKDSKVLSADDTLTPEYLRNLLVERIRGIDWEDAKRDVIKFLRNPHETDVWSTEYFEAACHRLKIEN